MVSTRSWLWWLRSVAALTYDVSHGGDGGGGAVAVLTRQPCSCHTLLKRHSVDTMIFDFHSALDANGRAGGGRRFKVNVVDAITFTGIEFNVHLM